MPFFRPFATFAHLASLVASCLVHPPSRIAGALFRSLHQCMHAHTYYRRSLSIRLRILLAHLTGSPRAHSIHHSRFYRTNDLFFSIYNLNDLHHHT
ncbi:hypothetical protein V8B97DRAFT_1995583 [Scleroderma yunnanense]